MIDLNELERLAAQATPGPWKADNWSRVWYEPKQGVRRTVADCVRVTVKSPKRHRANARLIAAMHEALPELIAEHRALREKVRELEAKNKDLGIRSMLNNGRAFRLADYIANSGMCAFCPAYDEFCMADGACRLVDCIEAIYKWADKQAAKEAGE